MKAVSRICSLGLALVLLQACQTTGTSSGNANQSTLERIAAAGQINLGYRTSEPPMSFTDQSGIAVGYSIDLCGHVANAVKQELGRPDLSVKFVPVTAETRFEAIERGEIDLLCGATTKTLSRSERVDFTQLTFATGASLITLENSGIGSLSDLRGKRVAAVAGTTTIEALRQLLSERGIDAEVITVSSAAEGMAQLDQGAVAALSADQVVLIGLVLARQSGQDYALADEVFTYEPFALALRRGDADFRLIADRALAELNRTGRIGQIYLKWFGRFAKQPPDAVAAVYALGAIPE
ncbi:amino acid ABC transporter substrate-binding protein [Paralimibaculum aggregatum]|uniref:Amino acid ABC transporter substrate-binding protein n=2 Tax=Paralimibaculum aggregatum TaxID=3036245 RepID=A0ABQ6LS59_9RHOB|nr:amino acid ABC transporter substrate-binding protein [Limibaculum sp. NKW23]